VSEVSEIDLILRIELPLVLIEMRVLNNRQVHLIEDILQRFLPQLIDKDLL
jgi:hypothetical protein